ncbi:CHASE2 domain-containing protein [Pelagicoccus sp. SDUM812003]|uniref:CHASE2 domain-containing protein n=1 Tax=Pelagicoccus sp. SDUM812003 TaxID=3041267 RepID=UPI00280E5756|nr:CHASE2 domain-containing protein [Pelagicoccus sp. SDUM812003]MDQ8204287.1 CHASE2 domain-containing protein [Pelagicoccus sp. SDUM812003]
MPLKLQARLRRIARNPFARATAFTAVAGVLLLSLPPLAQLSYDASFLFKPADSTEEVVLILTNEDTLQRYGENGRIGREHHAKLIERLSRAGVRSIFYDFAFIDEDPENDFAFAKAIKSNGSVVLVAAGETLAQRDQRRRVVYAPTPLLREAAKTWGHAELFEKTIRRIPGDFERTPYAGWLAAQSALISPQIDRESNEERWLNYYGPEATGAFTSYTFQEILNLDTESNDWLTNKSVFIGQYFTLSELGDAKDTFSTAFSRFGWREAPGVAIHATAFLNLIRDEWLRRLPWLHQCIIAICLSLPVTGALYHLSRRGFKLAFTIATLLVFIISICFLQIQYSTDHWVSWISIAVGQPTAALIWTRLKPRPSKHDVFISYRTHDDEAAALLIAQNLWERGCNAFIDVKRLEAGRFDEQLIREIEAADTFVIILSPGSLDRCASENDWVRREIARAMDLEKRIVPVLKGGFSFKETKKLGIPEIERLSRFQGLRFSNKDFDGFMNELLRLTKLAK